MPAPPTPVAHIAAIIVTFHPDLVKLEQLLDRAIAECTSIFWVANSPLPNLPHRAHQKITCVENQFNLGLAHAQNQGLNAALANGAEWLLLFDQDSLPADGFVATMVATYRQLESSGKQIGALGPTVYDSHSGLRLPFHKLGWITLKSIHPNSQTPIVQCDYVIASGSLMHAKSLIEVGLLLDDMFIHNIDLEWCFRASRLTNRLHFGTSATTLKHSIGDSAITLLGRPHPRYAIKRQYFIFRNSTHMLFLRHIPLRWKTNELLRIIPRLFLYSIVAENPIRHLIAGLRGIRDGLLPWPQRR